MGEIYLADGTRIKETKVWRASRIRDLCRERGWFDKGSNKETVTVEDIMTAIANGAVATFYRIQQGSSKPGFTKRTAEQFWDDWEAKQFRKDWGDGESEEEARHEG